MRRDRLGINEFGDAPNTENGRLEGMMEHENGPEPVRQHRVVPGLTTYEGVAMADSTTPPGEEADDPMLLRGGSCATHGYFNNFSGRCLACIPVGELLRHPCGDA